MGTMGLPDGPKMKTPVPAGDGSSRCKENDMLKWAIIFAIISIIAGIFGFSGIAAGAASIAKVLFFIFLAVFIIFLLAAIFTGKKLL